MFLSSKPVVCKQKMLNIYSKGQNKREFFSIFLLIELFLKHVSIVYQTKQQTIFFKNPKTEWLYTSSVWFYGSSNVTCKKRASQKSLHLAVFAISTYRFTQKRTHYLSYNIKSNTPSALKFQILKVPSMSLAYNVFHYHR